ncbi:MAG: hypothetical protein LBP76_09250 [Treponema sp.]|jgi:hypothetical protein|nr:hypothetical protein [Treponema sp.]
MDIHCRLVRVVLAALIFQAVSGCARGTDPARAGQDTALHSLSGTDGSGGAETPALGADKLAEEAVQVSFFLNLNDEERDILDQMAELERSGAYTQGMALAESNLREKAGDYAGAVVAAFKELSWAYGYGNIEKPVLIEGLKNVLNAFKGPGLSLSLSAEARKQAEQTVLGLESFLKEDWNAASALLIPVYEAEEEFDAFSRWLFLVCTLENGEDSRAVRSVYAGIRARYELFPEYWYRGARRFSGLIAAEYAEHCINLAPEGPFAAECRGIIAAVSGLEVGDGEAIRSKAEIESIVNQSVNRDTPELLSGLFPLISLPENPYTVYAVNALRSVVSSGKFRAFFTENLKNAAGRLAERLTYISRG